MTSNFGCSALPRVQCKHTLKLIKNYYQPYHEHHATNALVPEFCLGKQFFFHTAGKIKNSSTLQNRTNFQIEWQEDLHIIKNQSSDYEYLHFNNTLANGDPCIFLEVRALREETVTSFRSGKCNQRTNYGCLRTKST